MRNIIAIICLLCCSFYVQAQTGETTKATDSTKTMIVDASCGHCKFGMKSEDCALAVKIKGKAYWVEGASIDDFGDAHGADGMCKAVRKAEVSGEIKGDKYVAKSFKLLPEKKKRK